MRIGILSLAFFILGAALTGPLPARAQRKDYLSAVEADKIRDAVTPSLRIKLFLSFAAARIKRLQYELDHPGGSLRGDERLNGALNSYADCVDEAADLIDLGVEKQQDISDGIKEMQDRGPEFLAYLKELAARGTEVEPYRYNLDDAIEATLDAIKTADQAVGEVAPPPVRRRP